MRVLFVASPLVGHVLPLVPLARAFRDAGHDILLVTGGEGTEPARSSGLDVRDAAPGLNVGPLFMRRLVRHPVLLRRTMTGDPRTDAVGLMFAAVSERMADAVVEAADGWRPDLVVHEPLAAAGALAAARRQVPSVLVEVSLFDAEELLDATTRHLGDLARRHGVERFPPPADVLITVPPSLLRSRRGRPMRYVPPGADGPAPDGLDRPGDRPRVIVSRSTAPEPGRAALMRRMVAVSADADVEVVLVRPDRRLARGPLPRNVRTADWLPFPSVFPAAAAVAHHGGAGTLMTALAAGVPQLVVPGAGDRTVHARLVADRGAGLAVPAQEITADVLTRLVSDPALKQAAGEVAAEIAAMPAPAELVGPLVALTR